ncbi:MAG: DUF1475 family protein [Halanaerobiales bacterium]|nr:DUF1475 family protein [Halanaerobiales bacterium]
MKTAKILALLGFVVMSTSIITGFISGDFAGEGSIILSLIWGKITLIDIYIMFLIFASWIYYRENKLGNFLIWFILLLIFGAATASLYIYLALKKSDGDWNQFWLNNQ